MADSYKLTVLKRLTTLIEGTVVSPIDGIDMPTDLTGRVFRGRLFFGHDEADTMVSILEAPRQIGSRYTDEKQVKAGPWSLLIQGWCPEDKANPTDSIYSLLDDVEKRLARISATRGSDGRGKYAEHYMLGAAMAGSSDSYLIHDFEMGDSIVRPPQEGVSSKSFFYLPVQVGLARNMSE